jgi:hypothetical protein
MMAMIIARPYLLTYAIIYVVLDQVVKFNWHGHVWIAQEGCFPSAHTEATTMT